MSTLSFSFQSFSGFFPISLSLSLSPYLTFTHRHTHAVTHIFFSGVASSCLAWRCFVSTELRNLKGHDPNFFSNLFSHWLERGDQKSRFSRFGQFFSACIFTIGRFLGLNLILLRVNFFIDNLLKWIFGYILKAGLRFESPPRIPPIHSLCFFLCQQLKREVERTLYRLQNGSKTGEVSWSGRNCSDETTI